MQYDKSEDRQPSLVEGALSQPAESGIVLVKGLPSEFKKNVEVVHQREIQLHLNSIESSEPQRSEEEHYRESQSIRKLTRSDEGRSIELLKEQELGRRLTIAMPVPQGPSGTAFLSTNEKQDREIFQAKNEKVEEAELANAGLPLPELSDSSEGKFEVREENTSLHKPSLCFLNTQAKNSKAQSDLNKTTLQTSKKKESHSIKMKQAFRQSSPEDLKGMVLNDLGRSEQR